MKLLRYISTAQVAAVQKLPGIPKICCEARKVPSGFPHVLAKNARISPYETMYLSIPPGFDRVRDLPPKAHIAYQRPPWCTQKMFLGLT